jgi:chloramphenicol-sensitive protein RarD
MSFGPLAAATAFTLWGVFPLYLKQLAHVQPLEIVLHRSLWSLVFVFALLGVLRRYAWMRPLLERPRVLATFALSALLLAGNWLLYVWAINNDRIIDASLGYFINPLLNVMLGYLVLHERPRPVQWAAIALAAIGVAWLTFAAGQLPWIGLVLAGSFGTYGLLRKTAVLGALEGLALETLLIAPLALVGVAWLTTHGGGAFGHVDRATDLWLIAGGPFTAIPLLLFAAGARRVRMATLGLLQYLGPTITFLIGVLVYHEPFDARRGVGFALIWIALVVYSGESVWQLRGAPKPAT